MRLKRHVYSLEITVSTTGPKMGDRHFHLEVLNGSTRTLFRDLIKIWDFEKYYCQVIRYQN